MKDKIIEILEKHEGENGYGADFEPAATEILALFETGQSDVVIDPEKETLKEPIERLPKVDKNCIKRMYP